jgi:Luciferase-like monooxygenase
VAELAEELGYDSIWAGEHLSFRNPILDLGIALSTCAAVTRRIALGAGVVLARIDAYRAAGAAHISFNPAVAERGPLEQIRRIRAVVRVGAVA